MPRTTLKKNFTIIDQSRQRWYALRVKSNFESQVSQLLRAKDVEEYLPVYKSRRAWSDRIRELELPLFPGYVFCHIGLEARPLVLATRGVVGIAGTNHQPIPIDDEELAAVRKMIETQATVEPWPFLKVGERVRVHRGPLRGVEGVLLKAKDSHRLVVSITLLGRSVASEIDAAFVRRI